MLARITLAALAALGLTACDTPPPAAHAVVYKVTSVGDAQKVSLTLTNDQGGSEQLETRTPYERPLSVADGGFVYVSAQNGEAYGDVSCDILIDGKPFKHSDAIGAYTIATCSGSAGRP